ncbi:hypothetical protein Emag_002566 [Eimeria magna]
MATSSPAYAVHLLEAARAWTDAQYFRLLSRELPVDSHNNRQGRRASVEGSDLRCVALPSTPKFPPAAAPQVLADAASKAAHAELGACNASRGTSLTSSTSSSPGGWSSPDAAKKILAGTHHHQHQQQQQQAVLQVEAEDSSGYVGGQMTPDLPPHNLTSRWRAFWRQLREEERGAVSSSSSSSSSPDVPCTKLEEEPSFMTAEERVLFKASDSVETTASSVSGKTAISSGVEVGDDPPASPARQKRLYTSNVSVDSEAEKLRRLPKVTGVRFQAQRNRFVAECKNAILLEPKLMTSSLSCLPCQIRSLLKRHCPERISEAGEVAQGMRDKTQDLSSSSPIMESRGVSRDLVKGETNSSLQERLFLAQAALNVVLIDLLSKCLPCGSGKEAREARKLVEQLHRQLQCIYTARDFAQLRQSLWFNDTSVTNTSSLSSARSKPQAQPRTLLDLLEVAAPRG